MKLSSKIALHLLCAIGVLVVCACDGNNEVRETLQRAESLMEDRPDSSLQIIKDIDTLSLKSLKDIALYSLLRTQAEDKNYKDTTDTRIITRAVDYYAGSNDEYHKMLSYYYRARIEQNAKEYSKAIVDLMKAETAGLKLEDWFHLGLIYCVFSDIYNSVYSNVESLKYAQKERECFVKADKEEHVNWALADLWRSYNNGGNYEPAVEVADSIVKIAELSCDTLLLSYGLRFVGVSNLGAGKYNESIAAYTRLKKEYPDYLELSDYVELGIAYLNDGQFEKAKLFMDYVEKKDTSNKWLSYEVYAKQKDYEKAFFALRHEYKYQDKILRRILAQDVTEAVLNHNEFEQREKDIQLSFERKNKAISISVCILVIALLLVILWQRSVVYKKNILAKMAMLSQLQSSLNDTRLQNTNLQTVVNDSKEQNENLRLAINELYGQTFKTIDDLCGEYYLGEQHDKRIVKKIDNLVEELKKDGKTIAKLETFVNKYRNNVVTRFRSEYPDMRDVDYKLFLFMAAGFSLRTICVFVGVGTDALSNRKYRLKKKISESFSQYKEEFLGVIG